MRNRIIMSLACCIAIAGCNKRAEGQSVAIVNGEEITAAELNSEIASSNLPNNQADEAARNRILQSIVDRRLLVQQALKQGVDKTPEYISKQRRVTDDLLISMLFSRQANTASLPEPEDVQRYQDSNPQMFAGREIWTLEQIQYPTPEDKALLERIAKADTLDDLARLLDEADIQFQRGRSRMDTADLPSNLVARINSLDPSAAFVLGFPAGGRSIANVIVSRQSAPRTGEAARPIAVEALRKSENNELVAERLKDLRSTAEITYQEGFAPSKPAQK